jgi:predicted nucleic acid-binding protein
MNILDASALLAFLNNEKGALKVKGLFESARKDHDSVFIHQCNFIEVTYKSFKYIGISEAKNVLAMLSSPFFAVSNIMDDGIGYYSAYLKNLYPVSLADAIGLAFTKYMEGIFYTADKVLLNVAKTEGIPLELIR